MKERPILFSGPMVNAIFDGRKTQTRRVVQPIGKDSCFVILEQNDGSLWPYRSDDDYSEIMSDGCEYPFDSPYGKPSDRLWVRETWADVNSSEGPALLYRADHDLRFWDEWCIEKGRDYGAGPSMNYKKYPGNYSMWWEDLISRDEHKEPGYNWRPSIFMPRWACRLVLEIVSVRVERLQHISEEDAFAEGCKKGDPWENGQGFFPAEIPDGDGSFIGWDSSVDWFADLWDSINAKRPGCSWEENPFVWVVEFKRVNQ